MFVQSDVPEVSELCWLLMTGTPMGLLGTLPRLQGQKAKGLPADAGLFTYPVLMAADILIYDAEVVPVGEDQTQHIEVCRDMAASFNHHFGQTFVLPKAKVVESSAKVPGTDGEKMSKSYNNTLELFEEPKALRKKIMRITTDSRPMEQPKEPEDGPPVPALFAVRNRRRTRRNGGYVSPRRLRLRAGQERAGRSGRPVPCRAPARRAELAAHPERIHEILADGASRARIKAAEVLRRASRRVGSNSVARRAFSSELGCGRAAGSDESGYDDRCRARRLNAMCARQPHAVCTAPDQPRKEPIL